MPDVPKLACAALAALLLTSAAPRPRPPTIVLISIVTWRADHLGAYGYRGGTSPFLDELGERGTVFEEAVRRRPRLRRHGLFWTVQRIMR
jgi:glucan phosphoethanolaminetransferase (alkaline phosphatase superfamily)